ncbi:MAG: extracellular solute-binding protein [Alphaproteobacteria bacterium]
MSKFMMTTLTVTVALVATSASAATKISWWHAMAGTNGETVSAVAQKFNASQNLCEIEAINKGTYEDNMTATIAAFRAGNAPNISQIYDAGAATIIGAKGAAIAVEDLFKESGVAFDSNDYIPGVRYFYADSQGKMIGMPFNSSTPIMYYNKDILEKLGLEPPKTWEEFEEMAPKIKEAGYIGLSQSHTPWIFVENYMSRQNQPFATNNNGFDGAKGTKILTNNEALINFWTQVKGWSDAGYYKYYGAGWGDNQTPFEQGKVAFWLGSSGDFGNLRAVDGLNFSATLLPYQASIEGGNKATYIGGGALFALSGKPKEENDCTVKFFEFLAQPETQYFWHKSTGYVPVTTAAYELAKSDGYYEESPAAETGVIQLNLEQGDYKGYRMGFYPQIREVIYKEFEDMINNKTDAKKALNTVEKEGNKLLERFAKTVR